ncbi:MAG: zinc-ribbon domain-containing protein, partial [Nitrospinae bacterium]|nr:zinc-ribbon domain-containing protein [Nitrospinota bacterium]
MKITCPRCSSVYKIDGAALSQEGTYLKCARCSNIFFARRRSKSEAERLRTSRVKQRVAAPVAAPQAIERPEPAPAPVHEPIPPVMPETPLGGVSALEQFVRAPAETPESVMDAGLGDITLEEEAPPPPSVQDDIDA